MRGPQEARVTLARTIDVRGVVSLPGDEAVVFLAAHRGADAGRTHHRYSAACRPACPGAIARAPAAIALTMLWYPVQGHRLPSSSWRIVCSSSSLPLRYTMSTAAMIMP